MPPDEDSQKKNAVRGWIYAEHVDEIDTLQRQLGTLAGGVVLSRDQVINVLLKEALAARAEKKAWQSQRTAARKSAKGVDETA